jgi:hypothetical protein
MLDVSIGTFFYLFMRLFPFIIVCFFVIISIFSWDIKGFVYLVGLIITTGFFQLFQLKSAFFEGMFDWLKPDPSKYTQECVEFFPTDLPINQIVIGFTMAYLFNTLVQNGYRNSSSSDPIKYEYSPIVPFFIVVFVSDLLINTSILPSELSRTYCTGFATSMILYTISIGFGLAWSQLISSTNNEAYIFFTNYKKDDKKCEVKNATKYQCKRYVNGILQSK